MMITQRRKAKKAPTERQLLKQIESLESALGKLVTKLWKQVDPTSDEQELATDTIAYFNDEGVSDLQILRWIIDTREDAGK